MGRKKNSKGNKQKQQKNNSSGKDASGASKSAGADETSTQGDVTDTQSPTNGAAVAASSPDNVTPDDQESHSLDQSATSLQNQQQHSDSELSSAAHACSQSSSQLTQEALSAHTHLLQASDDDDSSSAAAVAGLPSGAGSLPGSSSVAHNKRHSMTSHDDVESGVGTYSVQSEMTHRDDTFMEEPDVEPDVAEVVDELVHLDNNSDEGDREGAGNDNDAAQAEKAADVKQDKSHIEKQSSSDLTSSQTAATLSRQSSHDLGMTSSRGLGGATASSYMTSSLSTMSRTSTGYAYHSTGSDLAALTSTHSVDDPDLDQPEVEVEKVTSEGHIQEVVEEVSEANYDDEMLLSDLQDESRVSGTKSSDTHLSATTRGSDIDKIAQDQTPTRLSIDTSVATTPRSPASLGSTQERRRVSGGGVSGGGVDYDLESSIDSVQVRHAIRFSNPGLSLFDELQMCGIGASSSAASTPVKSRSSQRQPVVSQSPSGGRAGGDRSRLRIHSMILWAVLGSELS